MSLLEEAQERIPGVCLGAMSLPNNLCMVMVRGERSKIYDSEGKEYIDFCLGSGPLILGHAHPAVIGAVKKQLDKGSTFYALNEPAIRLAGVLTDAVPCAEGIRFQTTGSEATFSAVRLARAWTGREKILKFEGSFHGGHDLGQVGENCDGIPDESRRNILVAPFNDTEGAARMIRATRHYLAAVMVEPMQRVLTPEPGFLEKIREVTRECAIPLIFDEVVTGFRLAWGGAQERYGVTPDLACYGKVIGGGFPVSAVVGRREILELADPSRNGKLPYAFLGGTLTGNPIACAAGLETLDILSTPGVYGRLHTIGERMRQGIREIGIELDIPLQVLGDGPVLQPFFIDPDVPLRNHQDLLKADSNKSLAFGYELIRRGVYYTPGGKFYLSLAHSDDDIDRALGIIKKTLQGMK